MSPEQLVSVDGFSGVRLVTRGGSVVEATCDGFADIEAGRRWTPQTPSQIASISKQFAAAVTLMLVDHGSLTLDDSVATVLPGCRAQWRDVSIGALLTHTAGVRHWCDLPGFDPAQPAIPGRRLEQLLAAPLADRPGQVWRYSSPGYIVLSAVLETAGRRRYSELVQEHIIDRLGLTGTTVGQPGGDDAARGYRHGDPVAPWDLHTMPGTGDIWSTADDLAQFLTALHAGGLLPERIQPTLYEITVSQGVPDSASPVSTTRYGLGHFQGTIDGEFAYLHPGDNPGYQSLAAWLPATATLVVALCNDEDNDIEETVADLVRQAAI